MVDKDQHQKIFLLICLCFLLACGRPISDLHDSGNTPQFRSEAVIATKRLGNPEDDQAKPQQGGLILMGGGPDVDSAFIWAHDRMAGHKITRRGDVLILRASGSDGYDSYIHELAPFNSVQTLIISPHATGQDLDIAARFVRRAEFVFFAGGNQAHYVAWKNSRLMSAVQNVFQRGGVVGGTSAGLAIMGQFVFDAVSAGPNNVTTDEAVQDPFAEAISFTRNMLEFPLMQGLITDSHFEERDRMGRLAAFMARQIADGAIRGIITGVGINEGTAVIVDSRTGVGYRAPGSSGAAYFIRGKTPSRIKKGETLLYEKLQVMRLDTVGQFFHFKKSCGTGPEYEVSIDGEKPDPYSPSDVYTKAASPGRCPDPQKKSKGSKQH